MRISLVILTCNQRYYTLRCLRALEKFMAEPDCEVILVDNGSTDGTHELVAHEFENTRIIRLDQNRGVAVGRNIGLRLATGRHLMILDNDTIATSEAIFALSAYLDRHPEVGVVGPRLTNPDGLIQTSYKPFPGIAVKIRNVLAGASRTSIAVNPPQEPFEPFYVIGAAQMFPRYIYEAVGGLDENIFYGPEDADFCMAVRRIGKKIVYNPAVTIIHDWQRATTSRLFSAGARHHIAALLYFYRKHRRLL